MKKLKFCLVPTYYTYGNDNVVYMWRPDDNMLYQLQFYTPPGSKIEPVYFGKLQVGTKEVPMPQLHRWVPCEGWSLQQLKDRSYGFKQIEVEVAQDMVPSSVELE